jgi:transcriptional regulator with XRE-family HTH domain
MKAITAEKALQLWDKIKWLEKMTDNELAIKAQVSQGTISKWRSEPKKEIRFSTLRQMEENLGYIFDLDDKGQWEIQKRNSHPKYEVEEENENAFYWKEQALKYKGEMEAVRRSLPSEVVEVILETAKKYDAHRGASKKQLSGKQ